MTGTHRAVQSPIDAGIRRITPESWRMLALAATGLLVASNLAWWSTTRSGAEQRGSPPAAASTLPAPERVIYEYGPTPLAAEVPTPVDQTPTPLRPGERCAGGQIIRRLPNGWEGVGRPCTP
ncbi:hypothetical protein [Luteimonas deserti]|uniref:Uncharacterized protein n=1 Tax=Luteimonas deserti TaxID=2752306 RepID=A0A7Z0QSW3_9GAMM|nr:hypothetical protein [Luteimonas deserti]NYZ64314.1 hypothetical protein [Luteimonas deserti]